MRRVDPVAQQRPVVPQGIHIAGRVGLRSRAALALAEQVHHQQAVAERRDLFGIGEVGLLGAEHIGKQQDARARTHGGIGHDHMVERLAVDGVDQPLAGDAHDRLLGS